MPQDATELGRLPIAEERLRIGRRRIRRRVRVAVRTAEEARELHATLRRQFAEIERVRVDREVEAPPPVRHEGDTLVVPVVEERVVLVRRLVVTEEIRFRLRTAEEEVVLPAMIRRQEVSVERTGPENENPGEHFMQRTITALFDSRAEAERAAEALQGLNVRATNVHVEDASSAGAVATNQDDDRLNYSSIGSSWMPEEDRATYHEGIRRGGAMVVAQVDDEGVDLAMDAMEAAGAVDLDTREAEWRSQGWTGGNMAGATLGLSSDGSRTGVSAMGGTPDGTPGNPPGTMASRAVDQVAGTNISGAHPEHEGRRAGITGGTMATGTTATGLEGRDQSIPIAEERLRVGKRVAHAGRVRVRSYVVETPVEEQVHLREEHVRVERRAADSPGIAGEDLFRERVIEAEESIEEAVVSKEARVTGEVVVNKESTERTETIRDTVRRTEVEVNEDDVANDPVKRGGKGVA